MDTTQTICILQDLLRTNLIKQIPNKTNPNSLYSFLGLFENVPSLHSPFMYSLKIQVILIYRETCMLVLKATEIRN